MRRLAPYLPHQNARQNRTPCYGSPSTWSRWTPWSRIRVDVRSPIWVPATSRFWKTGTLRNYRVLLRQNRRACSAPRKLADRGAGTKSPRVFSHPRQAGASASNSGSAGGRSGPVFREGRASPALDADEIVAGTIEEFPAIRDHTGPSRSHEIVTQSPFPSAGIANTSLRPDSSEVYATNRPSGETLADLSLNGVTTSSET